MNLLCKLGWHKWSPVKETIERVDKYTVEADIICDRCGEEAHGTQENYW